MRSGTTACKFSRGANRTHTPLKKLKRTLTHLTASNIDEGWLKGRNAQGQMYEDLEKFPSGMKGLGDWVHSQGFLYGLYSCRGTCQCGTATYSAPGSHGHEADDVDYMVAAGADYLKIGALRPLSAPRALARPANPPARQTRAAAIRTTQPHFPTMQSSATP